MLTPEQIGNYPDNIVDLFEELEEFILVDIARRLKKTGTITSTAEFQRQQAQLYGIKNIEAKISEILGLSNKQIEDLFPEIALTTIKAENEIYKKAKLKTIQLNNSKKLQEYLKKAIKTTKGDIENITQSLGFTEKQGNHIVYNSVAKFYQKELNIAHLKVVSGTQDYVTAIKQATRKIADSGVRTINYEKGYSVNIDTGIRRAVLTSVHQMNQETINNMMDEIVPKNEQYAEVSAHSNARPTHQVWQGQVYKIEGSDENYENLEEATDLGSVGGLCGANCRHSYYTFIPGISERAYTKEQLKNINTPNFTYKDKEYTGYEATQYQRQLENEIRKLKRENIIYKETGLNSDVQATNARIKELRNEYKEFSDEAGISPKNNRMQI